MKKNELICPVRRLEKPGIEVEVKNGKDDLINIKANIKIKNPVKSVIDFINKKRG